jgi:hypothetical protein
MSADTNGIHRPKDEDVLLPFERENVAETYQEFLRIKRNNTFASIQRLPHQWQRFELMDQVWLREIGNLKRVLAPSHVVVGTLFIRAYARVRLTLEIAFAGCTTEAADLLRGAIESAAQAHKIHRDPELAGVWLEKDRDKLALEAYRNAFERNKKAGLFAELPALHYYWSHFSELAHSTVLPVLGRVELGDENLSDIDGNFQFFEVDPVRLNAALDAIYDAEFQMERVLFNCFSTRLDLDIELVRMRRSLQRMVGRSNP